MYIHLKDPFATRMLNEPSLFRPMGFSLFCFVFFPPADAYNRAASGVVECVWCDRVNVTERWPPGRAGGERTQQPVSISPLTGSSGSSRFSEILAYLVMNLSSLPQSDAAAAAGGRLQDGCFAPKRRALTQPLPNCEG